jgi:hypothetical protein
VNSGFKIVITAKIKLRQQKKKEGRQVCEFCDKQDSLKGSQLYRKKEDRKRAFSDQGNDHAEACSFSDKKKRSRKGNRPFYKRSF